MHLREPHLCILNQLHYTIRDYNILSQRLYHETASAFGCMAEFIKHQLFAFI